MLVSEHLINRYLDHSLIESAFYFLEGDLETQAVIRMGNVMAVKRMGYNDHGVVHSRIVAGSAMLMFDLLRNRISFSSVKDWGASLEDARLITFLGAYLHDIGNSIHRESHHVHGCYVASPILDRLLRMLYEDRAKALMVRQEVLSVIFSHDEGIKCLSKEAGIVKVADGTDMAKGRARIPYSLGKVDIHSLSALSITRVEVEKGDECPVLIKVHMKSTAGIFRIETVLMKKVGTSGISEYVEVVEMERGREIKRMH